MKNVEFGKTASDYAKHRAGFPDAFFERLVAQGVLGAGMAALDIGSGTGTVARGFAAAGCAVTACDRSFSMLRAGRDIDNGAVIRRAVAPSEFLPFADGSFDVIGAGQCWHWFDRTAAAAECYRLLRPGGYVVIGHFDWIPLPGNVVDVMEHLVLKHNPEWPWAGGTGIHPKWFADLTVGGFVGLESWSFDVDAPYTHEGWRGRIRASAGVAATLPPEGVRAFDAEHAAILKERFPEEPLLVPHRVFTVIGKKE